MTPNSPSARYMIIVELRAAPYKSPQFLIIFHPRMKLITKNRYKGPQMTAEIKAPILTTGGLIMRLGSALRA